MYETKDLNIQNEQGSDVWDIKWIGRGTNKTFWNRRS